MPTCAESVLSQVCPPPQRDVDSRLDRRQLTKLTGGTERTEGWQLTELIGDKAGREGDPQPGVMQPEMDFPGRISVRSSKRMGAILTRFEKLLGVIVISREAKPHKSAARILPTCDSWLLTKVSLIC